MRKAIGTVMNTHKASRQSKKASRMQVRVTVMPFAISGGIVLLSRDSMLLQSAIIFVVSSERRCNYEQITKSSLFIRQGLRRSEKSNLRLHIDEPRYAFAVLCNCYDLQ